jgi:uncharacterized membrane protein
LTVADPPPVHPSAKVTPVTATHIANRVAASLLGSWAFVWGFSTLGITGLVALGQPYDEARTAVMLVAFLIFLAAFCWTFAAASIGRVWAALGGGAIVMTGAAWLLQRALV